MKEKFKVIRPFSPNKLRDIQIAIDVASNIKIKELVIKYEISDSRIRAIYRIYMAYLSCFLDEKMTYMKAVYDKNIYKRNDSLKILKAYEEFLKERVKND